MDTRQYGHRDPWVGRLLAGRRRLRHHRVPRAHQRSQEECQQEGRAVRQAVDHVKEEWRFFRLGFKVRGPEARRFPRAENPAELPRDSDVRRRMHTNSAHRRAAALLVATLCSSPLVAQETRAGAATPPSGRGSLGVHLQVTEPKAEFAANTNNGFGIGGYVMRALDGHRLLNLRGDVSLVSYANSRRRLPLAGTGGLIQLDLRTSSNIVSVVAGPQLLGPTGPFMPYATALGGFSVFWTESAVEGSQNTNTPFASTTNATDAVWAYGGAVGSYILVHTGTNPVRLDLGARFLRHDDVRYLTADRVRQAFDNNRPVNPVRGRADFITYYLGVNVIAF